MNGVSIVILIGILLPKSGIERLTLLNSARVSPIKIDLDSLLAVSTLVPKGRGPRFKFVPR